MFIYGSPLNPSLDSHSSLIAGWMEPGASCLGAAGCSEACSTGWRRGGTAAWRREALTGDHTAGGKREERGSWWEGERRPGPCRAGERGEVSHALAPSDHVSHIGHNQDVRMSHLHQYSQSVYLRHPRPSRLFIDFCFTIIRRNFYQV